MNWSRILEKSWQYLKKYQALWWLGILAALTATGSNLSDFSNNNHISNSAGSASNQVLNWISNNRPETAVIAIAVFLIFLVVIYASVCAKAGLIFAIDRLESEDKKPEFTKAFYAGEKFFWRIIGLAIIIALIILAAVFVLIGTTVTLIVVVALTSLWWLFLALPLGLIFLSGLLVLVVFLQVTMLLAEREIVIENRRILAAFGRAKNLIENHFAKIFIAWLIQLAISVAFGIAILLVTFILGGALFAAGAGIYFAGGLLPTIIFGSVGVLVFIAVMLAISGGFNAFVSTFWTLTYRKVKS